MRIVHLSDFHLNKDNLIDSKEFIIKALIEDLKIFNSENKIDLVVVSGDLIDKGGKSFEGDTSSAFESFAENIIDPISTAINLSRHSFFFCPGNHDIDRNADAEFIDKGLCETLTSVEAVNKFIDESDDIGVKKILPFKNFEKSFYKEFPYKKDISIFQSCYQIKLDDTKVGIACFNSCWRCDESRVDKNNILLGERQVTRARPISLDSDVKIAVIHHPLDWLSEFDKKAVKNFILKDYDMIFFGHTHEATTSMSSNFLGSVFVSVAPSNWTYNLRSKNSDISNGYSIVDYNLRERKIKVNHRKYYHSKEAFDIDPDQSKREGITEYLIPHEGELTSINEEINIASAIENVHLGVINEHLLSYNTDTKAPKEIDQLFVHPILESNIKADPEDNESSVSHAIEELCASNDNILIFGTKESGKTILLDKFLIDFTKQIYRYGQVPILCDYTNIKGKRHETIISRFLNIGIKDIDAFLSKHKTVLLIDNIDFNIIDMRDLNKLKAFLEKYPKLRIIATCLQNLEAQLPLDIVSFELFSKFKPVHIRSFKTKEIKALIEIWFRNDDRYDTPRKLEKIIDFFSTLNLPRTPLALSMLLWIIEQQENYRPINQAVMLENFIERLFKKQSRVEIFADTFDFTNKQRLLADIAKEMYGLNNENYRIFYHSLFSFIETALKIRRFDYTAEKVLDHFLDTGILIKEYENSHLFIRFRFTCFFQYFLMRYMEYDSEFLKFVMQEENYLYFVNEIDYYTGIKRDQTDILKTIIERMCDQYQDIIQAINKLPNSYDEIFLSQEVISKTINDDFLNELPVRRPNEKEIEKMTDQILESLKVEKGIRKKDITISDVQRFERYWVLASKVLKNTEETKIEGIKDNSYRKILECSLAFAVVYKLSLDKYLKENKDKKESQKNLNETLSIAKDFIPLLHELALFSLAGSKKLSAVIRDKIEQDLENAKVSDFEKFVSVFLYSDLRGKDYQKYINQFIRKIKHAYIYDMTLFKTVSYYFFRSKKENLDNIFENIIGYIIVKAKGRKKIVKGKVYEEYKDKGKIIQNYRKKREERGASDSMLDID